jgi:hypothetical protein
LFVFDELDLRRIIDGILNLDILSDISGVVLFTFVEVYTKNDENMDAPATYLSKRIIFEVRNN